MGSDKRKKWYEREEVRRINKDWVDINCKFTERELKILELVYYRKMVRRDHLEILHDGYRNIPRRTNVINRSIKKLFDKMCLDKVHEEQEYMKGNKPCILSVDRAGCIILDKPFNRRFEIEKRFINNKELILRKLPSYYNHVHGVNQLEIATLEFCLENNFEIIIWNLEEDNLKEFEYNKEKIILKPDIFVILNIGKPLIYFIEYDTGSENRGYKNNFPTILDKLEKYQKYKSINLWQVEWWAKKIKTNFPLLLFVTEDEKRVEYIKQKGKTLGLKVDCVLSNEYKERIREFL